jgi:structural maintenance of chromosome 2
VNQDFGSIFSTLLPGTQAKLEPAERSVLEGLEVKVAFGSVWKESLSELSGGQRSLLALSLILALLRFKPAPMYILDEVMCLLGEGLFGVYILLLSLVYIFFFFFFFRRNNALHTVVFYIYTNINATSKVDAALDLSHTQNIGAMLRTHFSNSQFIVVSLKEVCQHT